MGRQTNVKQIRTILTTNENLRGSTWGRRRAVEVEAESFDEACYIMFGPSEDGQL